MSCHLQMPSVFFHKYAEKAEERVVKRPVGGIVEWRWMQILLS
jgi:hypothetical protein